MLVNWKIMLSFEPIFQLLDCSAVCALVEDRGVPKSVNYLTNIVV